MSLSLLFVNFVVQAQALPKLTASLPEYAGLIIGFAVSWFFNVLSDLIWTPITIELNAHFHNKLVGAPLTGKERDSLRKCDNVDTIIRLFITKIIFVLTSLVIACQEDIGLSRATVLAISLVGFNLLSRWLTRQSYAIKENWELTLKRNDSL